jgi:hypothetical protein
MGQIDYTTFFELRPVLVKTTLQLSVAAPLVTEDLFFCHQLKAQIYKVCFPLKGWNQDIEG